MPESQFIRLEGFTRVNRHEMLSRLRDAFQSASTDVLDYQMFSNTAISLSFETRCKHLGELETALDSIGLALDDKSLVGLRRGGEAEDIVSGSLNVTFILSEPDLRIPVPPIPG